MQKDHLQTILHQGIAATRAGQRKQARQLLMQVVEQDMASVQGWLWLGIVLDDPVEQFICFQNVLRLEPDNSQARTGLAWLESHAGKSGSGSAEPNPVSPSGYKRLSPRQHQAKTNPYRGAGQEGLQRSSVQAPRCPFCKQALSPTMSRCPHCRLPLVVNCPACDTRVDIEQQVCPHCGQWLGNYRQGAAYFARLAQAYQERQRGRQTLDAWQAVEALQPDYPRLAAHLGQAQAVAGQTHEAIAALRQALEQNPGEVSAALALGKIYHQLHRWEEAEAVYRRTLKAAPRFAELHFALGWLLMDQRFLKGAMKHIRQATRLDSRHGLAWFRLGQLYETLGKRRPAIRAYRRATKSLPTEAFTHQKAEERLTILAPPLPKTMSTGWSELIRQVTGPVVICVLAALLDAGLRPWWISRAGWLALFLATLGALLWTSATTLPRNHAIRLLVGGQGLSSAAARFPVGLFGALCWLLGLGIILYPLGQALPEAPK